VTKVTVRGDGLQTVKRDLDERERVARDMRRIGPRLRDHELARINVQMLLGGSVPGKYGRGWKTWAPNAPSTIRKKGFNRPLFGTPKTSGFRTTMVLTAALHSTRSKVWGVFTFTSTLPYAEYNHFGTERIPARAFQGFNLGSLFWLVETDPSLRGKVSLA
jgi:hypothetical protein